jgi:hypothetical protein
LNKNKFSKPGEDKSLLVQQDSLIDSFNEYHEFVEDLFTRYSDVVKQLRIEKAKNKMLEEKMLKINPEN